MYGLLIEMAAVFPETVFWSGIQLIGGLSTAAGVILRENECDRILKEW